MTGMETARRSTARAQVRGTVESGSPLWGSHVARLPGSDLGQLGESGGSRFGPAVLGWRVSGRVMSL